MRSLASVLALMTKDRSIAEGQVLQDLFSRVVGLLLQQSVERIARVRLVSNVCALSEGINSLLRDTAQETMH